MPHIAGIFTNSLYIALWDLHGSQVSVLTYSSYIVSILVYCSLMQINQKCLRLLFTYLKELQGQRMWSGRKIGWGLEMKVASRVDVQIYCFMQCGEVVFFYVQQPGYDVNWDGQLDKNQGSRRNSGHLKYILHVKKAQHLILMELSTS